MTQPRIANANEEQDAELSITERLCRHIADWTGAPIALLGAIVFQLLWIVLGMWTRIDPFPFVFLLTVSNVIQLVLIFVIAVAQRRQSRHDELRAEHDHEALAALREQLQVQEWMLLQIAHHQGIDVTQSARQLDKLAAVGQAAGSPPTAPV